MIGPGLNRCTWAYRGLMYHVAYHILKNPQDAEDAVHQSFVKLAEHMVTIPDGPCPRTRNLVVTVAERKAIDLYRSRQRHPETELDEQTVWSAPAGRAAVWPMPWHPCRPGTGRCFC